MSGMNLSKYVRHVTVQGVPKKTVQSLVHLNFATVSYRVVRDFIEPSNWPPNSPDLNLVDYSIWDTLQQLVHRQKIEDTDHLKQVLNSCRELMSQELINGAIDQWSKTTILG